MIPPADESPPCYVTCACQHCDGHIEFDANRLEEGEMRPVPCPHCGKETLVYAPPQAVPAGHVAAPPPASMQADSPEDLEIGRVVEAHQALAESSENNVEEMRCGHWSSEPGSAAMLESLYANRVYVTDIKELTSIARDLAGRLPLGIDEDAIEEVARSAAGSPLEVLNRLRGISDFAAKNRCSGAVTVPIVRQVLNTLPQLGWAEESGTMSLPTMVSGPPDAYRVAQIGSIKHTRIPDPDDGEWVPPGIEAAVEGYVIPGGMVYLGKRLACVCGSGVEPSLINTAKPIERSGADCHIRFMGYWPSYDTISPGARASYLHWLSTGKCDPVADMGYVFLYFYGLERRVLLDATRDSKAGAEIPLIEGEVRRLIEIYGQNGSFRGYASSLLDYLAAAKDVSLVWDAGLLPESTGNQGMSFDLRLGLGLLAKSHRPLPADWALTWLYSDPTVRLRTAASRCAEIFGQLFKAEYAKSFGEGLQLPENKIRLKITHRPASPSFSFKTSTVTLDIPDVSVMRGPVNKLCSLAEICTERLDAYSRFVGRNPDRAETFDALSLLHPDLWPTPVQDSIHALRRRAIESPSVLSLSDFQSAFPQGIDLTKSKFTSLSRALASFGLGVEPDPRFGGPPPGISDPIVLFPCEPLQTDQPLSADFASGALLLHLASAVAGCDGELGEAEENLLLQHIKHGLDVTASERHRLAARLQLYRVQPPSLAGLKKRIEGLNLFARESLGDFLALVVRADGVVKPDEVRVLEKLWKLLGLEQASLYTRLHGLCAFEPVTLRKADGTPTSFTIPPQPPSSLGAFGLDPAKVAALKAESAKVSVVLGAIFAESEVPEAEERSMQTQISDDAPALLRNLDPDHHHLLQVLLQRPQWSRAELEELCADRGLMLDGAMECINEAAFECFGQALIEENEEIDINCELIQEKMP
jgi:hypothetical protein